MVERRDASGLHHLNKAEVAIGAKLRGRSAGPESACERDLAFTKIHLRYITTTMSARHTCNNALTGLGLSGYLIRSYVAASRAEVRPYSTRLAWRRTPTYPVSTPHARKVRSFATKHDDPFADSPSLSDSQGPLETTDDKTLLDNTNETPDAKATKEATSANAAPESPPSTTSQSTSQFNLPWYLQTPDPTPSTNPFSERQRLPDLPLSPPTLLCPLLSHISIELGMDDLSLLDLRTLDPPAALGSNLLMILGTARSEKHLHVSADRLCRWLRTEHQLRPFADGLLGRNELKLKMKRKAKRSRLLSSVGAKATGAGDVDDGIRTGWVCVNVGEVEGGVLAKEEGVDEDFVGFRTEATGCRVVVQMMTEEKRGQLDLESLWAGILNRSKKEVEEAETTEQELHSAKLERRKENQSPFPEAQTTTIVTGHQMGQSHARV